MRNFTFKILVLFVSVFFSLKAMTIGFGIGTDMNTATPFFDVTTGTAQWQFGGFIPSIINYPHFAVKMELGKFFVEPDIIFGFNKEDYTVPDSLSVTNFNFGLGMKGGTKIMIAKKGNIYSFFGFVFRLHKYDIKPMVQGADFSATSTLMGFGLPFGAGLEYFFTKGFAVDIGLKFPLVERYSEKTTQTVGTTTEIIRETSYTHFLKIELTTFRLMFFFYL